MQDLLIQVVDFSDENYRQQMQVTADTLKELGAGDIPQIIVYNKADKCEMEPLPQKRQDNWYLAAGLNIGIRELAEAVEQKVYADNAECSISDPVQCRKCGFLYDGTGADTFQRV